MRVNFLSKSITDFVVGYCLLPKLSSDWLETVSQTVTANISYGRPSTSASSKLTTTAIIQSCSIFLHPILHFVVYNLLLIFFIT